MTKRGTILRGNGAGPALLAVDGDHYQFSSQAVWRSPSAPMPGMEVNVEFAPDCRILRIAPVTDSAVALPAPQVFGSELKNDGLPRAKVIEQLGVINLIVSLLLLVGWILLTSMSVQTLFGRMEFSFWELLGFLNSGSAWESVADARGGMSVGIYGLLAILALAAPYVPCVWRDKRADAFGLLPLLFMLYVGLMVRSSLHNAFGALAEGPLADVQRQAQLEMMRAVSLGPGAYFCALVCLYFAAVGAKRFLQAYGINTEVVGDPISVARGVQS